MTQELFFFRRFGNKFLAINTILVGLTTFQIKSQFTFLNYMVMKKSSLVKRVVGMYAMAALRISAYTPTWNINNNQERSEAESSSKSMYIRKEVKNGDSCKKN